VTFKVKELRDISDENARITLAHQQAGKELPSSMRHDFTDLLLLVREQNHFVYQLNLACCFS